MSAKNRKQQKKNKPRNKMTTNDGILASSNAYTKLPRSVTSIIPDRMYTKLRFYGLGNLVVPTVTNVVGARYRPTAAFDIDPLLGSTATPGFAELSALYGAYRVTTSIMKISVCNQSATQGAVVVLVPLLIDPGATPTFPTVTAWTESPYAVHKLVGVAGSPTEHLSCSMSTEKISGSKWVYFDDNWTSAVSTVPVNNWYWAVGAYCPVVPGTAVTINTDICIDIGIEFFQRKFLTS